MSDVECIVKADNILGEVPLWSASRNHLYWIDVRRPALFSYNPESQQTRTHPLPEVVGSFCETSTGRLLLACKSGLYFYDPDVESLAFWMNPEPQLPNNRLNDGKCDRQGRFWVGSMNDGDRIASGTLYSVGNNGDVNAFFDGLTIPNSLAWSPDGRRMYFADTPTRKIMSYDFDINDGVPHNPRVFRDLAEDPGRPDGATVDSDGCLWSAQVRAGRVVRYTPDGRLDRVIQVPATMVTSCAFGGSRLDTLYITTATQSLSADQLKQQPLAGGLFAIHPGVTGLAETKFIA